MMEQAGLSASCTEMLGNWQHLNKSELHDNDFGFPSHSYRTQRPNQVSSEQHPGSCTSPDTYPSRIHQTMAHSASRSLPTSSRRSCPYGNAAVSGFV